MKELLNVEIARAGKDLTLKQLEEMVKNLDLNKEGIPAVVGHPRDNSPAYGWLKRLWLKGKSLMANFEVVPEFFEWLEKKLFKNRSISYYPNYQGTGAAVLRHVGFLGGTPPQIKGMNPLLLTTDEDFKTIELDENEFKFRMIGDLFQNLRDWLIEEVGLEVADRLFSMWTINDIRKKITEVEDNPELFIEKLKKKELKMAEEKIITYTEVQHKSLMKAALQTQESDLKTISESEIKTLTDSNATLKKENDDLKVVNKTQKAESTVTQLIKDGKIWPKEKEITIENLMGVSDTLFEKLVKQYTDRKPLIQFGEDGELVDYGRQEAEKGELKKEEKTYSYADREEKIEKAGEK